MVCYFNVSSLNFHAKCFSSVRHWPLMGNTVVLVNSMDLVGCVSFAVSNALEHIVFLTESYFLLKVGGRFSFVLVGFFVCWGAGLEVVLLLFV